MDCVSRNTDLPIGSTVGFGHRLKPIFQGKIDAESRTGAEYPRRPVTQARSNKPGHWIDEEQSEYTELAQKNKIGTLVHYVVKRLEVERHLTMEDI